MERSHSGLVRRFAHMVYSFIRPYWNINQPGKSFEERSHSGLVRAIANRLRVYNPPWVRLPPSPPLTYRCLGTSPGFFILSQTPELSASCIVALIRLLFH